MGADGDWTACGGYENRATCPIEDTSTPIMCEDGNCETDGSVCSEQDRGGVKYGSTPCENYACSPNTANPRGLLCTDGTMGVDGDWTACGGYENRAACPIEDTSTPIMCEDGNCETDGSVCSEQGRGGVKYGSTPCENYACSPNTANPRGLLCTDGTMGADGDWTACGGYETRAACPIEDTSTPIMCEDGNCETDGSVCSEEGR